jgi:alpha-tubulin suppressor-like RCC1 family protein
LSWRVGSITALSLVSLACSHVSEVLTPIAAGGDSALGGSGSGGGPGADGGLGGTPAGGSDPGQLPTSSIDAGTAHSCATLLGVLYCWGDNAQGQLGLGDTTSRSLPTRVGESEDWAQVAAGEAHSCARLRDGKVFCFGANNLGQLGAPTPSQSLSPLAVDLPAAREVATEINHVCALSNDAELYCWGENSEGQLGQDDSPPFADQLDPTQVGSDADWTAVDTGQGDTCGLRGAGDLYCWGRNTESQLGLGEGAPTQTRSPSRVDTARYLRVQAGQDHSCAIDDNGRLYCWGLNDHGNLGTGDREAHSTPYQIGDKGDWLEVSLDTFHTCAIDASSDLYCWGRNAEGQLGVGDTDDRLSPTRVPGGGFSQLSVGRFHTCALKPDQSVWCTGANDAGQLGLGDTARRSSFEQLTLP